MRRLYTCLNGMFIVLISLITVISTFHSHHDIQWNSTQKQANTRHSITVDSGQCPVCGYLFNADPSPALSLRLIPAKSSPGLILESSDVLPSFPAPNSGRSPPASS